MLDRVIFTLDDRITKHYDEHYSNHLNTRIVWYWNGSFVSGCQMVRYSNGGVKIGLKKPVYRTKYLLFKWSTKWPNFTSWIPDTRCLVFKWIWFSGVWYSDGYCIIIQWESKNRTFEYRNHSKTGRFEDRWSRPFKNRTFFSLDRFRYKYFFPFI